MSTPKIQTISLDFEFRRSQEKEMQVICACIRKGTQTTKYDLRGPSTFKSDFRAFAQDHVILCYFASAETRALLSLGFTPTELLDYRFCDLFIPWRMLTHSHPKFRYGTMFVDSKVTGKREKVVTVPPPFGEVIEDEWEEGEDGKMTPPNTPSKYRPVGLGMADAIAHRLEEDIDTTHKTLMRELILGQEIWTEEQFSQIMDYCAQDVRFLLPLCKQFLQDLHDHSGAVDLERMVQMSRYSVCMGIVEANGIPVHEGRMRGLVENYFQLDQDLVDQCNEVFPFYAQKKATKAERLKGFPELRPGESDAIWAKFLEDQNLLEEWPKSEKTGKPKKERKIMEEFDGNPAISAYVRTRSSRKQLQYFRPQGFHNIEANLGSDSRIRTILGAFGTKTGRNAPSVRGGYIFAMSSWLRPLISPPTGKVCIGADFSAQEICLQGFQSKDDAFLLAYASGDPYTWFAQTGGIMRPDVVRNKEGKFDQKDGFSLTDEEQKTLAGQRNLTKALLLGIGFGMGLEKLAQSLTAARIKSLPKDQGDLVRAHYLPSCSAPDREAALDILAKITVYPDASRAPHGAGDDQLASYYKGIHQKVFKKYWKWRDTVLREYGKHNSLILPDGWELLAGEDRPNTIANFPIQGLGASILRRAVELCLREGLEVFAPLHDAIYIVSDEKHEKRDSARLVSCMEQAVGEFTGDPKLIRIDPATYHTDWVNYTSDWTKDKGGKDFARFGKYMVPKGGPITLADLPEVKFDEEAHKYAVNGVPMRISVTGLLGKIEKPFDEIYWSMRKSDQDQDRAAALRAQWRAKNEQAKLKGTLAHAALEQWARQNLNGGAFDNKELAKQRDRLAEKPYFIEAARAADRTIKGGLALLEELSEEGYTLEGGGTEIRMTWPELFVAGTADLILRRNGKWVVADWKTNEDLDKRAYGNFQAPFDTLPASKVNGYALQMSIYRVILEERWGIGPWEDEHLILWTSEGMQRLIRAPHIPEARVLLDLANI